MRHAPQYAPSPLLLPPSPTPALNGAAAAAAAAAAADQKMLVSVFLALFLPCVGMSAVFVVYICLLWFATNYDQTDAGGTAKQATEKGLSVAELEKLPKVTGKELVMGTECAVCLEEIEDEQPARMVPGCNHGFHLQCADTWLTKHSVCPVCRAKLEPQFFNGTSENPC
ncbi:hypothetical protein SLE2022_217570 [Rubroshorea leprosula]